MDTAYKRKDQKMKPVDLGELDNTKPRGYTDWKRRMIEVTQTQNFDTGVG